MTVDIQENMHITEAGITAEHLTCFAKRSRSANSAKFCECSSKSLLAGNFYKQKHKARISQIINSVTQTIITATVTHTTYNN